MADGRLLTVDAKQSDGVIVHVIGAAIAITSHKTEDRIYVVITPDEVFGYQLDSRWFPGLLGRLGQLVTTVWR